VLLWKVNAMGMPFKTYTLLPDPSALRAQPKLRRKKPLGATALSLSKVESGTFAIGTESGGVHRCFLHAGAASTADKAGGAAPAAERTPVVFSYQMHRCPALLPFCSIDLRVS
jgi:hypothetical protein